MDALAGIRQNAGPYPVDLLEGCETALLLFGAGFLGLNDGIHIADAGLDAFVIDIDREKLEHMVKLYPKTWTFCEADAWWFAENVNAQFDVVSVDNYTGDAEVPVLASLPLWCSLARKVVTVTKTRKNIQHSIPHGWEPSIVERSSRADWLVLERA